MRVASRSLLNRRQDELPGRRLRHLEAILELIETPDQELSTAARHEGDALEAEKERSRGDLRPPTGKGAPATRLSGLNQPAAIDLFLCKPDRLLGCERVG